MNKRIKELYGNALDKAVPYTWHNLDHAEVEKIMKEFAELIVRDIHAYVDGLDTAQIISNGILKRYGVEE